MLIKDLEDHQFEKICVLCGDKKKKIKCALVTFYSCEVCDSVTNKVIYTYEENGETRH